MKIIFLIRVFRWCTSVEPWTCLRRPLSCPNSNHHLFPASISEFKYSINQDSRPSVNSEEHPSSKKIFPTFILLWPSPSLLIVALPWGKPATPALLALAFACHPIRNDRKQNHFPQIVILVRFLNRIFTVFEISICFQFAIKNFTSCCLSMAIIIARFIGIRQTNICCKEEKDIYMFRIQCSWSFHFKSWSKIWNSQFLPELVIAKFQQHSSTTIKHVSWTIDRMKAREYLLEIEWSPLYLFYSSLGLNPIPTAPISYFLTAARSQVRFDISIRIVVSRFYWPNWTLSVVVFLQKCTAILVLSPWLRSRLWDLVNWHQRFIFHQMMSLDHASAHNDPPSVTTSLLCGSLLSTSDLIMQSKFPSLAWREDPLC
jgi:hypothetical protein